MIAEPDEIIGDLRAENATLRPELGRLAPRAVRERPESLHGIVPNRCTKSSGIRITEVWETREDYDRWYNGTVKAGLPSDLQPSIQVVEVDATIQPLDARSS